MRSRAGVGSARAGYSQLAAAARAVSPDPIRVGSPRRSHATPLFYLAGWSKISDADLQAIAAFVKQIPAKVNKVPASTFKPAGPPPGAGGPPPGAPQ